MAIAFLRNFAGFLIIALQVLVLGRVLISWVDPTGRGVVARFLIDTTEPFLGPIRRMLPATGGLDLSPLLVLLFLAVLQRYV